MQIELRTEHYAKISCDFLAFPIFEDDVTNSSSLESLDKITRGVVKSVISTREFKPDLHKWCKIHKPAGLNARCLILLGAGKKSSFGPARLREIAGVAVRAARSSAGGKLAFFCRSDYPPLLASRLATEGAIYANYESDIYKTRDKESKDVESFWLIFEKPVRQQDVKEGIRRGTIVGEATNFSRSLANEPSNILTPSQLADRALKAATEAGLSVRIVEREHMEQLGMNAILAVGRGSEEPPKLIILQTQKEQAKRRGRGSIFALVGKGVTFDSGGISIKPAEKMEEMKADMAGGAAVIGAMLALARLGSRYPVIGLVPAVENLPSGKSLKPGDVIKSYLGKTIEIVNTDAEGRLLLADAIAYARTLGAKRIVDVATLTGACVVALGHVNGGMLGTDQQMMNQMRANCRITGEGLWQLPLDDDYRKAIKSEIADVKNIGDRWAGAITAAKFLQEFVEDTPWVHLDIAGVDLDYDGRPFACKGATGFGVRTLVQLLE